MHVAGRHITTNGVLLFVIVLSGLALRLYHLGANDVWIDEAFTVWMVKLNVGRIVATAATNDYHPPLYYAILHFWRPQFGSSAVAVRFPSLIFGVLAIPMLYAVGRQLFNKETGLIAALLLALSSFNIQYSQEARMYSLMALLALVSMYFYLKFLKQGTPVVMIGYALSTVLLLYTHLYALFILVIQNIYLVTLFFVFKEKTVRIWHWIALQAIAIALFVPWIIIVLISRGSRTEALQFFIASPTVSTIVQTLNAYAGTTALLALFLVLSALSLFTYQKVNGAMEWKAPLKALTRYTWQVRLQSIAPVYLLVVWIVVINIVPFAVSLLLSMPIYLAKYTIAGSAALFLFAAKGVSTINGRYVKLAVIGVIVVLCLANLQSYYGMTAPQAHDALGVVNNDARLGDVMLLSPYGYWLEWHYYGTNTAVAAKPFPSPASKTGEDQMRELQADTNGSNRVWFVEFQGSTPGPVENLTLGGLSLWYTMTAVKQFAGYRVYLFEK